MWVLLLPEGSETADVGNVLNGDGVRNNLTQEVYILVGEPRDQNKAKFNKVRQIAKFGMIVYYKIVINNLI